MMEKLLTMKYAKQFLSISFLLASTFVFSQEKNSFKDNYSSRGYLKYMQTLAFNAEGEMAVDNLIHNRLNFAYETESGHKFVTEIRNRIFYGASVTSIPNYGDLINEYDGVLPFEFLIVGNSNVVMSTIIDRAYYQYSTEKAQLRIGRQRINWGMNTTWNPNDLFNSYNIYDFDYEEREGADAIRFSYFPNYMSSIDVAYKFTGDWKTDIFSAMYKMNKWNYDLQFLVGKFQENISFGTGWAGSLKNVGFKGELTFFQPYEFEETMNTSFSTSFDYSLKNGTYLMASYLFNSSGTNLLSDSANPIFNIPNAEYLMPAKHNAMGLASYMISPIFSTSLTTVYSFGLNSLSLAPTATFSIMNNLDLDIIGQFFWQEFSSSEFQNIGNGVYWRFKWSF